MPERKRKRIPEKMRQRIYDYDSNDKQIIFKKIEANKTVVIILLKKGGKNNNGKNQ